MKTQDVVDFDEDVADEQAQPAFRLLGPLNVDIGSECLTVTGRRQRVVLAMLTLDAGRSVPVSRMIDTVWDGAPPATARNQIQICVSDLRRQLAGRVGSGLIVSQQSGYLARVPEHAVDVLRFRWLVDRARACARAGDREDAVHGMRTALALWRGEPLAGLTGQRIEAVATRLEEERLAVLEECIGLELDLGRAEQVIGTLRELLAVHPSREKLYAHLMVALYRSGRQADALAVFRNARRLLADEYGIAPGAELQQLERAVLAQDPLLDPAPEGPRAAAATARSGAPTADHPRPVPPAVADFVARAESTARLRRALSAPATGGPPATMVVTGAAGVGKTALALHAAHELRDLFPGQLFLRLRTEDGVPVPPHQVLVQAVRALGAHAEPGDDGEVLAAAYRREVAQQRCLVVLDDAAWPEQVSPLLPATGHSGLLVTSRSPLAGVSGARRLLVDVFEPVSSLVLLTRVLGAARVEADPSSAARLAELCGHLPLALRIAAERLSAKPHWPVAWMVTRLAREHQRLDELTLGATSVRDSIVRSYHHLRAPAQRLFGLLATLDSTRFAGWVAGPLLEVGAAEASDVLDELVDAQLVGVENDPCHGLRFQMHPLVRLVAREAATRSIPAIEQSQAWERLRERDRHVDACWLRHGTDDLTRLGCHDIVTE